MTNNFQTPFLTQPELEDRPLIKLWLSAFRQYSFNNDFYGLISLHVLIGQLIRNIKIQSGLNTLDGRLSLFLLQNSGSGKTLGWDFTSIIASQLKLNIKEISKATDAALVGGFKERKVKRKDPETNNPYDEIEGALKNSDIIHYDEASVLLRRSTYEKDALLYFQIALNPIHSNSNIIEKTLLSGKITLKPHCSLFFDSFMPKGMEEIALETGLLQRCITFPRYLTTRDRARNQAQNLNLIFSAPTNPQIQEIITSLKNISQHDKTKYSLALYPNLKPIFDSSIQHIRDEILQNTTHEVQEIMETFFSRLLNHLITLSIHSTLIRNDPFNIKTTDIQYASRIMLYTFKHLINWFESDLVIISPRKENRLLKYRNLILEIIKHPSKYNIPIHRHGISKNDISDYVSQKLSISKSTASTHVSNFIPQTHQFHSKRVGKSLFYHPLKPYKALYPWWNNGK